MALTATQHSAAFQRPAPLVRHRRIPRHPVLVAQRLEPKAERRDPLRVDPNSLIGRLILEALRLLFRGTEVGFALSLLSIVALCLRGLAAGQ